MKKAGTKGRTPTSSAPRDSRRATAVPAEAQSSDDGDSAAPHWPTVVGIGASAGGLDAFTRLIGNVPPDSGLAYVMVQHLDPGHESLLPELLARKAAIPVVQVTDGMRIEPNHAYVIPPNTTMTVTDGHLRLAPRETARGRPTPIDGFLRSLAQVHGSGAIGVILSGAGTDGTLGLEAIKAEGGITMAQDSASAPFPAMPESAVATGSVDFVLPPEELAKRLAMIGRHVAGRTTAGPPAAEDGAEELNKILLLLRARRGVDFRFYRHGTVQRRILRRMVLHRQETRKDYLSHLQANATEVDALYEDLLIGVTRFFRDPEVFAALRDRAFHAMMKGRVTGNGSPVRAWVAGCSGGEETYSLAIALLEFLDEAAADAPIQIFATDLSETAIAKARAGLYPVSIEADVAPERLRRFFVRENGSYRIAKGVRDLCVFSRHDVVRDPPFSHLDIVSCRNVLIYLEPALQKRVFPRFHFALEPKGLLVLGSAESAGAASELFVPLDKKLRIYQPRATARVPLDLGVDRPLPGREPTNALNVAGVGPIAPGSREVESEADRVVMARYAPAGVVIDESMQVVQFRGRTSRFLGRAPRVAGSNLLKLARKELVPALRAAVRLAIAKGRTARKERIVIRDGDTRRLAAVEVAPFRLPASTKRFFVVVFEEEPTGAVRAAARGAKPAKTGKRASAGAGAQDLRELREELVEANRHLQNVLEQHEAANEELRAASEEIQSSNEELQSTNEELETTKEEIQATNEELTTVNEELRHRNRELGALAGDLTNVLAGTDVPILIVGGDLRIGRFTPATERVMRVIPTDVGRPLGDIKLRIDLPDLDRRILNVIENLVTAEQEVQDDQGKWWALTIRPYRTVDNRIDGAVLVFADIDATKRFGERAEEESEARRQLLVVSEDARASADAARAIAVAANQAKGAFLANMSHDLRTPLNAIEGYVDLLELGIRGPVTELQQKDFTRIKRSARHLTSLINDILNFAKLEAGHVDFHVADLKVSTAVGELEDLIAPQLRAKLITFECHDSSATVSADAEKVRQILLNLLTNAIKFTDAAGHIAIACSASDETVSIEVSDTGVGIPAPQLDRIFEPFVQIDRGPTSVGHDGVGLGLSISRGLARGMGGDLTVVSTVGVGSRFTLTLPRGAPADAPDRA